MLAFKDYEEALGSLTTDVDIALTARALGDHSPSTSSRTSATTMARKVGLATRIGSFQGSSVVDSKAPRPCFHHNYQPTRVPFGMRSSGRSMDLERRR
jgi:hypothetical protein